MPKSKTPEATARKISLAKRGKPNYKARGRKGNMLGKKHSNETKLKISLAQRGEKSHSWKGGLTSLAMTIRKSFKYRQWRSDVYTRDEFTCQECGNNKSGIFEAHHIIGFAVLLEKHKITTIDEALECEELWNINNGKTLCKDCHKKTDNYSIKVPNDLNGVKTPPSHSNPSKMKELKDVIKCIQDAEAHIAKLIHKK